jgi:hypothetical protein
LTAELVKPLCEIPGIDNSGTIAFVIEPTLVSPRLLRTKID